MEYLHEFTKDPDTCGGEYTIRGTRITVRTILASLAEGATIEEIMLDFPSLTKKKVQAVIMFAAEAAHDDFPIPQVPKVA